MSRPIVISGPSGGGKSTLLKRVLKKYPEQYALSVSHTTRQPRPGERHGVEYYFVSKDEMQRAISKGQFLEYAEFSGNLYGTSVEAVRRVQRAGKRCILDVELEGVRSIKKTDLNPICVLVKPPSLEVLKRRLEERGTESSEAVRKRLDRAISDLKVAEAEANLFDFVIVNDDLEEAFLELCSILENL